MEARALIIVLTMHERSSCMALGQSVNTGVEYKLAINYWIGGLDIYLLYCLH